VSVSPYSSSSSGYSSASSSYSASSSCSSTISGSAAISCSAAISYLAAISCMSIGYSSGSGMPQGMWEQLWFHWIRSKCGCSMIGPSAALPLMPFFRSMCMIRNGNGNPHVLVGSATQWYTPLPEFIYLLPNDLGNGAPKALVERIQGTKKHVPSLCLVSQGTHVPTLHNIHKPVLGRYLCLAGGIPVPICILPLTHVGDDVFYSEHGGAVNPWFVCFRWLTVAFQNSYYVSYGHLDVLIVNGRNKDMWLVAVVLQIFIKRPDQIFICGGGDRFE
jgi:hypothetical protein